MFAIEKNIVPKRKYKPVTFPFQQMEVGDSFVVENEKAACSARSSALHFGMKASAEKIEGGKYRVWRIK